MKTALAVTSIAAPNAVLRSLAEGTLRHQWNFFVAGDTKSPADFQLEGCRFLSIKDQLESGFHLGQQLPTRSYARKNMAYLAAIAAGAEVLVETDDDNFPRETFWNPRTPTVNARPVGGNRWVNVYNYFSDTFIYPRGLPLETARDAAPAPGPAQATECLIQQGMADENPDVDALYRMLFPLPLKFKAGVEPVALGQGAWCPFNSQNTTFFKKAFPLLYMPAHCTMRMTDIWRGFVAQNILQHLGGNLLFHEATVWQERNVHNLHGDFLLELPGYQFNNAIRDALMAIDFGPSEGNLGKCLELSYQCLIRNGWIGKEEEQLLTAWLCDLAALGI